MSQINSGIRSILSVSSIYIFFQWLVGATYMRKTLVNKYVKPQVGDRILDIGCGPGDIVSYLPDCYYLGFDSSKKYIQTAIKRFGSLATFKCGYVSTKVLETLGTAQSFDIVLAVGILHHLNDDEALQLLEIARRSLKPGGRLITIDGVFVRRQSLLARWILSKDRGQNIRTQEGYLNLACQVFPKTSFDIRHDLYRIPYTFMLLECRC